jgi:hypothetical protein
LDDFQGQPGYRMPLHFILHQLIHTIRPHGPWAAKTKHGQGRRSAPPKQSFRSRSHGSFKLHHADAKSTPPPSPQTPCAPSTTRHTFNGREFCTLHSSLHVRRCLSRPG